MRRTRFAVLAAVVVAAGGAAAYSVARGNAGVHLRGGPMPRSAVAACAGPKTAVQTPRVPALPPLRRAKLGNARRLGNLLWISTVYEGAGPTKTVIVPIAQTRVPRVVLLGWRCSDGAPLRFVFTNNPAPMRHPATAETGSKQLALQLAFLARNNLGLAGEFMFWSPGKWVVEARDLHGKLRGSVLFDFR